MGHQKLLAIRLMIGLLSSSPALAARLNTCTLVDPALPALLSTLEAYSIRVLADSDSIYRACTSGADVQSPLRGATFAELAREMDLAVLTARTLADSSGAALENLGSNPLTSAMLAAENLRPETLSDRTELLNWVRTHLPRLSEGLARVCIELRSAYAQNSVEHRERAARSAKDLTSKLRAARDHLEQTLQNLPSNQLARVRAECSDTNQDDQSLTIGQIEAGNHHRSLAAESSAHAQHLAIFGATNGAEDAGAANPARESPHIPLN